MNKNESILKVEIEQLLNDEIMGFGTTVMVQVNKGKLTKELKDLGLETMEDEECYNRKDIRCYYREENIDKLYKLIDRDIEESWLSKDGDVNIININFTDGLHIIIEIF